jgi:tetratricopeptide (TPR) repeat protein
MQAAGIPSSYFRLESELLTLRSLLPGGAAPAAVFAALADLEAKYPASGRLQQEKAHALLASGDRAAAIEAYRRAVDRNDALAESWSALEKLCRSAGRHSEATQAAHCSARLRQLPQQVARASYLLNEGELDAAEHAVRQFLQQHGAHADGMRILAQICVKKNVLDDAEMLLENIVAMQPDYDDARFEYATVLVERRRYLPALHEIRRLLSRSSANPVFRKLYASICDGLGESTEAMRVYRELATEWPQDAGLLVSMGHIAKACGESQEAVSLFKTAKLAPDALACASLALSDTKSYRFSDAEISELRAAEAAAGTGLIDRYQLCFALGKVLEGRSQYEESFAYYARGNALKRSESKSDLENLARIMQRQMQVCTPEFFAARRGFGCPRPDPIFIVGMPRAGSTLIEQILASHSQIDGTLELPDIPRLVYQFRDRDPDEPPRYPAILAELTPDECRQMGEIYLEDTRIHRKGAPFFLDKMPGNLRNVGFIHLILPNARIIDARREPLACCFGNFKQLFAKGMEFKHSLEELGRYYCQYVTLMEHWERVLPGKILRVQHEDVVNDLEGSVRRMLDFLRLPFEPACLRFHETARTIRTLSAEQVRRPINREGLEQWRHFEPWLGPLKEALAPLIGR